MFKIIMKDDDKKFYNLQYVYNNLTKGYGLHLLQPSSTYVSFG